MATDLLLEVIGLKTHFFTDEGVVRAVDGVDLAVERGKTLCIVGESGCGKSVTARSILQIVDPPGRIVGGQILFHRRPSLDPSPPAPLPAAGEGSPKDIPPSPAHRERGSGGEGQVVDLARLNPRGEEIRSIRGGEIAMIFQEPMTSLSPLYTVGEQIVEAILLHLPLSKADARARAIELLGKVGIPRPDQRVDAYPFQLSGGMRQRAMIAMALSCNPSLLIADEPTTALDVTTQAQILDLIRGLQAELGMAVMLITHDLGVVAEMADDVVVMYLGMAAERGDVDSVFHDPKHPYTRALLRSIPKVGLKVRQRLASIQGMVPNPLNRPAGCPFHTRCDDVMPGRCDVLVPDPIYLGQHREVRCLLHAGAGR